MQGHAVVEQSATIPAWSIDALLVDWTQSELSSFADLIEKFGATIEARSDVVTAKAIQRFGDAP